MNARERLQNLSRDQLIDLIEVYSKNWLAMDGVWFQSVEEACGMDEAMRHDARAWKQFTVIEAKRIKDFLNLPEQSGLAGLQQALEYRFYANINQDEITIEGNTLTYRVLSCRVQNVRARKQMELHPCKSVGIIEYSGFASTIDDRIVCECLSCYPEVRDEHCNCAWKFTLTEN